MEEMNSKEKLEAIIIVEKMEHLTAKEKDEIIRNILDGELKTYTEIFNEIKNNYQGIKFVYDKELEKIKSLRSKLPKW